MATKKRMIDINALLDQFEKEYEQSTYPYFHVDEISDEISKAPTVDAVEVVRCKDCKHNEHYDALLYCGHTRGLAGSVAPDSFCSYGERRTDNENHS